MFIYKIQGRKVCKSSFFIFFILPGLEREKKALLSPAYCTDFHLLRLPNRKWQTKRYPPSLPFEVATHWELPSSCCGQTNCFRVGSLGSLWASGLAALRGLCRLLSILTHLHAITPHPSPPSCAASIFFIVCLCFDAPNR